MRKHLLFVLLFLAKFTYAQIAYLANNGQNYISNYTDLELNGTVIQSNFTGASMTFDDDNSSVQNIGFSFEFNSTIFTQFVLNTNGFIKLGNASPSSKTIFYTATSGANGGCISAIDSNLIYPFNHDLQGAISPEYRVYTSGTSPNRVCTIQYKNVKDKMNTSGVDLQYTTMNFQIKLYEGTNNVEFVYGTIAANSNPSVFKTAAIGLKASDVTNSINVTKGSSSSWSTASFKNGDYVANYFNNGNGILPEVGRTYRFQAILLHDMAINAIWTMSKVLASQSNLLVISASISNLGNTSLNNITATLNVSGANNFTETKTITPNLLAPGSMPVVTFTGFYPVNLGINQVTITLSSDDIAANNTSTVLQEVTSNKMSYIFDTSSGYGTTYNLQGTVISKFRISGTNKVNEIAIGLTGSLGNSYDVVIYDANGQNGEPGGWLGEYHVPSGQAGTKILNLGQGVTIKDSFYVGLRVLYAWNASSGGIACEIESPTRPNTYLYKSNVLGSGWQDLSTLPYVYRPKIEVKFNTVLPLKFGGFSAKDNNNSILLKWQTVNEVNNNNFEVQRSLDGTTFYTIGTVKSSQIFHYSFVDNSVTAITGSVYYRLKQNDNDGKYSFSSIIKLNRKTINGFVATAINPIKENIVLQLQSNEEKTLQANLLNKAGQTILKQNIHISAGSSNVILDGSYYLSKGTYFLWLIGNGTKKVLKLMKE